MTWRAASSSAPLSSGSLMIYLFVGHDTRSKDTRLQALRNEFVAPGTEHFNTDTLYARDITLKDLQEKLLSLPINSPHRLVTLRDGQNLKSDCKTFLVSYARQPYKGVVLVIDVEPKEKRDEFVAQMQRWASVVRFQETSRPDTFTLCRQIESLRADAALKVLHQLLDDGEKPERIMGGLRYSWMRDTLPSGQVKKRLKMLLSCDREIKTGLLQPVFALEKLIVGLCSFGKPLH